MQDLNKNGNCDQATSDLLIEQLKAYLLRSRLVDRWEPVVRMIRRLERIFPLACMARERLSLAACAEVLVWRAGAFVV